MTQQKKQWGAILVMIALFAMIAFVTNLCSPMATIIKAQGNIPEVLSQIGNYGNFIAYLLMGLPAGMLIARFGYKKTALIGLAIGIVGIIIQWVSGLLDAQANLGLVFAVYLIGAFIAGFCMCILNCVVNPMLNLLGGGGKKGNQLVQLGGVFNSSAAVAVYILMGALIGEASKAKIADATPALLIALGIFVVAFIVICFTKIEEPAQDKVDMNLVKGAFKYRHFVLGIVAIFLYMGIEVGTPTYMMQYLQSDTPEVKAEKETVLVKYEAGEISLDEAALAYYNVTVAKAEEVVEPETAIDAEPAVEPEAAPAEEPATEPAEAATEPAEAAVEPAVEVEPTPAPDAEKEKELASIKEKIAKGDITAESISGSLTGRGMSPGVVGLIVAVYWLMMLVGRLVGASIGGKVSSRAMITTVSIATLILVAFGMFAPDTTLVKVPGIDWANLSLIWAEVPVGIFAFLLVGLCTSVMWGGIFNMAVEKLGKYTAIASGLFMTMVFGCAVMLAIQAAVADLTDYMTSYWVVLFCAAYILFYALVGSRVPKELTEESKEE